MNTHEILYMIIVPPLLIYFVLLFFIAVKRHRNFLDLISETKPNYIDNMGDFNVFNPFGYYNKTNGKNIYHAILPTNEKSDDPELSRSIKRHNKILEVFWLSAIILIPAAVIVLNMY